MPAIKDRVVVITGASAGIGAALAELVGARGGRPVLLARRRQELEKVQARSGPHATIVVGDVTVRADVERALAEAISAHGHVDVWVNNAGRGINRLVSQLTDEDLDEMVTVNVKSALYGMQVALGHFRARPSKSGHMINISSMLGRVPFFAPRSAYSASKHMLNALTANLRMELAAELPEVHVSTVLPGVVATEFGLNARGGGVDSRHIPGAQTAQEVAAVIASVIEEPRADVYSRPEFRQRAAAYYGAEDMGAVEASFGPPGR